MNPALLKRGLYLGSTVRQRATSGMLFDLYWQNSVAMDHRTWISPTIYMPPKFADYAANQDPIVEAIQNYHPGEK